MKISGLLLTLAFVAIAGRVEALPHFTGKDLVGGKAVRFDASALERPTVVIFLSSVCPCSKSHEPGLAALAREFKEVTFLGIHANVEEDESSVKKHFADAALPFPVARDVTGALATELHALKTPHAFVFTRDGLVFAGGVDDSESAPAAHRHYLRDALVALREGRRPDPARTRPLGCVIEAAKR